MNEDIMNQEMNDSIFNSIEMLIGRENALKLISQAPNSSKRSWRRWVYIPKKIKESHWIATALGYDVAQQLADNMGGTSLQPMNGNNLSRKLRNNTIKRLAMRGCSVQELAVSMNLSQRTIQYVVYGDYDG